MALALVGAGSLLAGCGGDDDDTPPPPPNVGTEPANNGTNGTTPVNNVVGAPPGQVMVTVTANSTPPGATVTGGGRELGVTPLQTQVPIPAPQAGQVQTFAFTFALAGYQPATINASPANNQITITAALAPMTTPVEVGGDGDGEGDGEDGEDGPGFRVNGRGGGPIFDNHTTTGQATVSQACLIDTATLRLSGTHSYYGDLYITLRDPSGNSYTIARGGRSNPFRSHRVRRASGRQAQGTWSLAIEDRLAQDSGILRAWSLSFTCR
ncbi:MAG: proprotein convertase P-domain-containing protein [Sandaracinaceae bacterium]